MKICDEWNVNDSGPRGVWANYDREKGKMGGIGCNSAGLLALVDERIRESGWRPQDFF